MHVHIYLRGMEFKKEKHQTTFAGQCLTHCAIEHAVAHRAMIDEEIIATTPHLFVRQHKTRHSTSQAGIRKFRQSSCSLSSETGSDALRESSTWKRIDLT